MKNHVFVAVAVAVGLAGGPGRAQTTYRWTQTAGGVQGWSTGGNWSGGSAPSPVSGDTVDFSTVDIAATTLTLDADRTAQTWKFGDTSTSKAAWTVSSGNTMYLAGSTPTIWAVTTSVTLNNVIDGSQGVTVSGGRGVTLAGNNLFTGGLYISAGTSFTPTTDAALGAAGGAVTFTGSATLNGAFATARNIVLNNGVTATVGSMTFNGPVTGDGGLQLVGNGATKLLSTANTFTGPILGADVIQASSVEVASLMDVAGAGQIRLGGPNNYGAGTFTWSSSAASALTLNNRQIDVCSPSGSGTIQNNNATAANTITVNTDLLSTAAGTKTLVLGGSNSGNNTIAGAVVNGGGTVNLTKTGVGVWVLSGASTYSGTTKVGQGTLKVSAIKDFGTTSAIGSPASGAIQLGDGNNSGTLVYTGAGDSPNRTVQIGNTTAANTGGGTINSSGSGALTFTAGAFNPAIAGITATRTLTLGGTYTGGANEIQGVIQDNNGTTGKLGLTKAEANRWVLSGANTYNGETTISGGALEASPSVGLPSTSYLRLDGGVLQANGPFARANSTTAGGANFQWMSANGGGFAARGGKLTVTVNNSAGTEQVWGTAAAANRIWGTLKFGSTSANAETEFQNNIDLAAATRTIDVAAGAGGDFATLSGVIRTGSGTAGLTKTGAGTLRLTNANTYNGVTTVSAGTLLVNNASGSGTGTGAVTVNSGGTLGGTGTIGGALTVNAGGTNAPGASVGMFTVSGSVTNAGTFAVEIDDAQTPKCDKLVVSGRLNITGGTLKLVVAGSPAEAAYVIASYGTRVGTFSAVNGLPVGYRVDYAYSGSQIAMVQDLVPPTLSSIVDNQGGGPVDADTLVTYTVTFDEDMDAGTVSAADFSNAGTAPVTLGSVTETSAGVFSVEVTPTGAGTLRLQIPVSAALTDVAGNPLDNDPALLDDMTLTVNSGDNTAPTLVGITDNKGGGPIAANVPVTYTVAFDEDMDAGTVSSADFDNAGTAEISIGSIAETAPASGVFTVEVTPTTGGTLELRIPTSAALTDVVGNPLDSDPALVDDTTITVDGTPPTILSIADNKGGGPVNANLPVTYTVTFDEDMDGSTVSAADFSNAGSAPVTIGAVSEASPGVFRVVVTPTNTGTLRLQVPVSASVADLVGNPLDSDPAVQDDTSITVIYARTLFLEDFESPNVAAYSEGTSPSGWVRAASGFGSNRHGLTDKAGGDFSAPDPNHQAYAFRYTNSGLTSGQDEIGTLTANVTYTVAFDVVRDDGGGAGTPYTVQFIAFAPGADRSNCQGVPAGSALLKQVTGNAPGDGSFATIGFTYTTNASSAYLGYDLGVRLVGATISANIDNVVVQDNSLGDVSPPAVNVKYPADNATTMAADYNLRMTFNEAVTNGAGNIVIKRSADHSVFETVAMASAQVTFGAGNVVSVNPAGTLQRGAGYYVLIDTNAIRDLAGNFYAGISAATTWNFTTVLPDGPRLIFSDSFESPVVSGSQQQTAPANWLRDSSAAPLGYNGYCGLANEDTGTFSTPYGAQAGSVWYGTWPSLTTKETAMPGIFLKANTLYTLTFSVARASNLSGEYSVSLMAFEPGEMRSDQAYGTTLASVSGTARLPDMAAEANGFSFTAPAGSPSVGKPIGIRIEGTGALVDNLKLSDIPHGCVIILR